MKDLLNGSFRRFINDQKFARLCERMACLEQLIEDYVRSIMKIRAEQPLMVCKQSPHPSSLYSFPFSLSPSAVLV